MIALRQALSVPKGRFDKRDSKLIKVQGTMVNQKMLYTVLCYDFETDQDRSYFFDALEDIQKRAEQLRVKEYEIADLQTGNILDIDSF